VNNWYFDPEAYLRNSELFYRALPVVLSSQLIGFFIVGLYRGTWQYESARDLVMIVKGVALGTVMADLALVVVYQSFDHSLVVFALDAAALIVLVAITRIFERGIIRYVRTLTR